MEAAALLGGRYAQQLKASLSVTVAVKQAKAPGIYLHTWLDAIAQTLSRQIAIWYRSESGESSTQQRLSGHTGLACSAQFCFGTALRTPECGRCTCSRMLPASPELHGSGSSAGPSALSSRSSSCSRASAMAGGGAGWSLTGSLTGTYPRMLVAPDTDQASQPCLRKRCPSEGHRSGVR